MSSTNYRGETPSKSAINPNLVAIYFMSSLKTQHLFNLLQHSTLMQLKIFVGTVTSTADYVAQAMKMECADLLSSIEVRLMDDLDISVFAPAEAKDALYVICTSTYGMGDVPDNALAFYESLDLQPRFLGHVRYGVIALGDNSSHSKTFCFGGKKFDARLQDLGAHRMGEICCLDAGNEALPEMRAAQWCRQWLSDTLRTISVQALHGE